MFSIVIPLYNKEDSILVTINSVLNQTFQDFEIIIINDGSCDKSLELVSAIADKRINIISKPNEGVSIARNTGIEASNNEWICFLDADDNWESTKLELYSNFIREHKSIDWIFSAYYIADQKSQKLVKYADTVILKDVLFCLKDGLRIQTSSVAIKKEVFQNTDFLFTPSINNSEDREVWYKLACLKPNAGYIGIPLSTYSVGVANSLTANIRNSGNVEYMFLGMKQRLEEISNNLETDRYTLLSNVIDNFNKSAILRIWVRNNGFNADNFSGHIDPKLLLFLNNTYGFPIILKKVLAKYIL